MFDIVVVVLVYVILVAGFLSALLKLFDPSFTFIDALLAAGLAGVISFIPNVGPNVAVIGVLLVVYWRTADVSVVTVLFTSFVSHLAAGLIVYQLLFPEN